MDEYAQAIEHDRQQIAALAAFPAVQFIPDRRVSLETRLYYLGVMPDRYGCYYGR